MYLYEFNLKKVVYLFDFVSNLALLRQFFSIFNHFKIFINLQKSCQDQLQFEVKTKLVAQDLNHQIDSKKL